MDLLSKLLEAPVHIILVESCVLWWKGSGAHTQRDKQTNKNTRNTESERGFKICCDTQFHKIKEWLNGSSNTLDCHLHPSHLSAVAEGLIQQRSPSVTDNIVKTHEHTVADRLNPRQKKKKIYQGKKKNPQNPWKKNRLPSLVDRLITGHETLGKVSKSDLSTVTCTKDASSYWQFPGRKQLEPSSLLLFFPHAWC